MDLHKLKWKAKLRKEQIKNLTKLAKLEIRHKQGKYKGEEFAYAMLKSQYKSWLHVDAEREYLEEHGLIPIEEEPENEAEPEPEKEAEPGLIRELEFFDLLLHSISLGGSCYTPTSMKEYEDRILLTVSKMDENYESTEHSFELPVEGRYAPFELDGVDFFWDREDNAFRIIPQYDESARKQLNEHLFLLDEKVLAAEKSYAEETLSEKCRAYAFKSDEKAYYWCIGDHSYRTVCHEKREELFGGDTFEARENFSRLECFCPDYTKNT